MFILDIKHINKEQEDAILYDGNILLIACPGSGKTRALTYKIGYELSKLTSEKKYVIAITYTHKAADEIKERIELLGVSTDQLWIGTIHSFCVEWILRPYHKHLDPLKYGFRIINAFETEKLISEFCAPYAAKRIGFYDCSHIFTSDGYVLTSPYVNKHSDVEEILKCYWQKLDQNHQLDFELILHYSFQLINKFEFISKNLSKIFNYILVDEYQDTREIQYAILSSILKTSNGNVKAFIVGDPNQAIYTSLGGFPIVKSKLEIMTGYDFKEMSLSGNYRSSNSIINYFDYFKTYNNQIIGCGADKDYKSIISYNTVINREALEDEIVRLIVYNVKQIGIKPEEICIVAPQWVHLAGLTRNLIAKLPDFSFNGPGMAPFSRDIDNFFFKLARIILTEPSPNLYLRRLRWSGEVLKELQSIDIDISHLDKKIFLKICNAIEVNQRLGIDFLKEYISILFKNLKIDMFLHKPLQEHYISFFKSAEERIASLKKTGAEFIATTENFKKVFKQNDGITISTIHGVKGAEYNTVIAFALLQGYVPHFADQDEDSAKKLLYVISSRAKKNLHLISECNRFNNRNPPEEYIPTISLSEYNFSYEQI